MMHFFFFSSSSSSPFSFPTIFFLLLGLFGTCIFAFVLARSLHENGVGVTTTWLFEGNRDGLLLNARALRNLGRRNGMQGNCFNMTSHCDDTH